LANGNGDTPREWVVRSRFAQLLGHSDRQIMSSTAS
jgi:hypothetical protein